jgi:hypothetical protein
LALPFALLVLTIFGWKDVAADGGVVIDAVGVVTIMVFLRLAVGILVAALPAREQFQR